MYEATVYLMKLSCLPSPQGERPVGKSAVECSYSW